jgi:hypothetical protein
MKLRIVLAGLLSLVGPTLPAAPQTGGCIVGTAKNGEVVKIRGELFPTAHDRFIQPVGCPDDRVILVYGDDASLGEAKLSVRRDDSFRQFKKYADEEQPSKANEICMQCPRYRVTADFEGRLDIVPSAGWKKDSKTGKVTGIEGFGHPLPFTRYRLVMTGVSNVDAIERAPVQVPQAFVQR